MLPVILLQLLLLPATPIGSNLAPQTPLLLNQNLWQALAPTVQAANQPLKDNAAWIKMVFQAVVENMDTTKGSYAQYFSLDYVQHTNGKIRRYNAFITHMQMQKAMMQSIKVRFEQIVAHGNHIATIHIVTATRPNGSKVRARVLAFFTLADHKIVACDEVTQPMET